jgi:hypothetical protein
MPENGLMSSQTIAQLTIELVPNSLLNSLVSLTSSVKPTNASPLSINLCAHYLRIIRMKLSEQLKEMRICSLHDNLGRVKGEFIAQIQALEDKAQSTELNQLLATGITLVIYQYINIDNCICIQATDGTNYYSSCDYSLESAASKLLTMIANNNTVPCKHIRLPDYSIICSCSFQ